MNTALYFVQMRDKLGLIKVGIAKNVEARIANLQTGNPANLVILGTLEGLSDKQAKALERRIHKQFEFCKVRGEWFTPCLPLRNLAVNLSSGKGIEASLERAWSESKKKARDWNIKRRNRG